MPIAVLPIIVGGRALPEGCDAWGIKSTAPDLTTRGGYQWPYPGQWATVSQERVLTANTGPCPTQEGDGLCVALDYEGMAAGQYPARTMLLVAYAQADVLGADDHKVRVRRAYVVALLDGEALARDYLRGADLRGPTCAAPIWRGATSGGRTCAAPTWRGASSGRPTCAAPVWRGPT